MSDSDDSDANGKNGGAQHNENYNSPSKRKRKKGGSGTVAQDYCFEINLIESNNDHYTEVNFKDLVAKDEIKKKQKMNGSVVSNGGIDPYASDDDDQLKALAAKYEAKYAQVAPAKKRKCHDYEDIGEGYDEDDPFIDNSECFDEIVPQDVTTAHGGFYINTGSLEFKANDKPIFDLSSEETDSDAKVKKAKKEEKKKISGKVPGKIKKAKMINTDIKTGAKKAKIINTERKKPGPKPKVKEVDVKLEKDLKKVVESEVGPVTAAMVAKQADIRDLEAQIDALSSSKNNVSSEKPKLSHGAKLSKVPADSPTSKFFPSPGPDSTVSITATPTTSTTCAVRLGNDDNQKAFTCPICPNVSYNDKRGLYQHTYRKHSKAGQTADQSEDSSGSNSSPRQSSDIKASLMTNGGIPNKAAKAPLAKSSAVASPNTTKQPKGSSLVKPAKVSKTSLPPPPPPPSSSVVTTVSTSVVKQGWQHAVTFPSKQDSTSKALPTSTPSVLISSTSISVAKTSTQQSNGSSRAAASTSSTLAPSTTPATTTKSSLPPSASPPKSSAANLVNTSSSTSQPLDFSISNLSQSRSNSRSVPSTANMFQHDPRNILATSPSDLTSILGISAPNFQAKMQQQQQPISSNNYNASAMSPSPPKKYLPNITSSPQQMNQEQFQRQQQEQMRKEKLQQEQIRKEQLQQKQQQEQIRKEKLQQEQIRKEQLQQKQQQEQLRKEQLQQEQMRKEQLQQKQQQEQLRKEQLQQEQMRKEQQQREEELQRQQEQMKQQELRRQEQLRQEQLQKEQQRKREEQLIKKQQQQEQLQKQQEQQQYQQATSSPLHNQGNYPSQYREQTQMLSPDMKNSLLEFAQNLVTSQTQQKQQPVLHHRTTSVPIPSNQPVRYSQPMAPVISNQQQSVNTQHQPNMQQIRANYSPQQQQMIMTTDQQHLRMQQYQQQQHSTGHGHGISDLLNSPSNRVQTSLGANVVTSPANKMAQQQQQMMQQRQQEQQNYFGSMGFGQ